MNELNQHRGDFENMLKEAADSLRLGPTPKVWIGIFNQLHPGLKYPSAFTLLIFIACYLLLGVNENPALKHSETNKPTDVNQAKPYQTEASLALNKNNTDKGLHSAEVHFYRKKETFFPPEKAISNQSNDIETVVLPPVKKLSFADFNSPLQSIRLVANESGTIIPSQMAINRIVKAENNKTLIQEAGSNGGSDIAYQIYATPAFRSVIMSSPDELNNEEDKSTSVNEGDRAYTKLNFEAGGNIIVPINQHFRLKAGFQFNYYKSDQSGFEETEPYPSGKNETEIGFMNTLLKHENNKENTGLPTYQFSMPIGADVMLAGDESVQWYAGATIQPGVLMAGDDYFSEQSNLPIQTPAKKWNMHGGIETFINVKLNRRVNVNLGPQFRYEIISSFRNPINFYDRPFQLGFKFGISTAF
jgi:hypothetical protein